MTDAELTKYLGPLIPDSRAPDKDKAQDRDVKNLIAAAQALLKK